MIVVAIVSVAALALVAVAALHTVSRMLRAHARERNLMLNQLLHLAGRTWQPPPAEQPVDDELEPDDPRFEQTPTQLTDY